MGKCVQCGKTDVKKFYVVSGFAANLVCSKVCHVKACHNAGIDPVTGISINETKEKKMAKVVKQQLQVCERCGTKFTGRCANPRCGEQSKPWRINCKRWMVGRKAGVEVRRRCGEMVIGTGDELRECPFCEAHAVAYRIVQLVSLARV